MNEWISIKKERPQEGQDVITIEIDMEAAHACIYENGLFKSQETGDVISIAMWITHWMPVHLPEGNDKRCGGI